MLTIRDSQMTALKGAARRRFAGQLTEIMANDFVHHVEVLGRPAFDAVIGEAIEQADGFGLSEPTQITDYVCTVLCCGDRFHEQPEFAWARALLFSPEPARARIVLDRVLAAFSAVAAQGKTPA